MSVELLCLCEFPIVVGNFEDSFWAWKVCDFGVHQSRIGFCWCECDGCGGLGVKEEGLEDWSKVSKGIIR